MAVIIFTQLVGIIVSLCSGVFLLVQIHVGYFVGYFMSFYYFYCLKIN